MGEVPKLIDRQRQSFVHSGLVSGLLWKQMLFGSVLGLAVGIWQIQAGVAVLFGVLLMLANAVYLRRCVTSASALNVDVVQRPLYKGAAVRFVGLIAGLVLAGVLGLNLLFVGLGIFAAQAVLYFAALYDLNREKTNEV